MRRPPGKRLSSVEAVTLLLLDWLRRDTSTDPAVLDLVEALGERGGTKARDALEALSRKGFCTPTEDRRHVRVGEIHPAACPACPGTVAVTLDGAHAECLATACTWIGDPRVKARAS